MREREGVIKYQLDHRAAALPPAINISELNAWRTIFYRLRLICRIPERYDGLGFGNISRRVVPDEDRFVITGSQTGHLDELDRTHYVLVQEADPECNRLRSLGLYRPSSEALTHACIYRQNPAAHAVIHVHCPELWTQTEHLQLPHTAQEVPYGTPQMARAVTDLFISGELGTANLFSMLGHEDGVVAFGPSLAEAAAVLITFLAKALATPCMTPHLPVK